MKLFLKIILMPFSALYGLITFIRNKFYDFELLHSESFPILVISVGNLSAGGTGKSPAIEYLVRLLQKQNLRISILSRGYGRNTSGFLTADNNSSAQNIGDEPFQFFRNFPDVTVSVCEDRAKGIRMLQKSSAPPEVILLDDAFQHRGVKPGLSLLLTEYNNLYSGDCMLPSGRLREYRSGARRADLIIVTKSPENISESEKSSVLKQLNPLSLQGVFFSFLSYKKLIPFFENSFSDNFSLSRDYEVLLFTGVANPAPLAEYLESRCKKIHSLRFSDHYSYSGKDIVNISRKFRIIASEKKVIITTEKDFSRLLNKNILTVLSDLPVFYIPVEMDFPESDRKLFEQKIMNYVERNQ